MFCERPCAGLPTRCPRCTRVNGTHPLGQGHCGRAVWASWDGRAGVDGSIRASPLPCSCSRSPERQYRRGPPRPCRAELFLMPMTSSPSLSGSSGSNILVPLSLTKCPSGSNRSGLDSGLRQYSRQRSLSSRSALSFRDLGEFLSVKSDIPHPLFRASQFCH